MCIQILQSSVTYTLEYCQTQNIISHRCRWYIESGILFLHVQPLFKPNIIQYNCLLLSYEAMLCVWNRGTQYGTNTISTVCDRIYFKVFYKSRDTLSKCEMLV